jgi:hypothetical protein
MRIALSVALAAALLLPALGLAVSQSLGMDPYQAAGAGTAPQTDVCPEIFQRQNQLATAGRGPADNPTLKASPCQHFELRALPMEEDRLLVLPRMTSSVPACYVVDLIRSVEALPPGRPLELRFVTISISGALYLDDIDVSTRLTFVNVDFFRPGLGRLATDGHLPPDCRYAPPPDPNFENAAIVLNRTNFNQPIVFEHDRFYGDLISNRSTFLHSFDIIRSEVGGDLVLQSSDFARDLVLAQGTTFRGQIVLDGLRVHGDLRLDNAKVIDTYLQPEDTVQLLALPDEQLRATLERAEACVCARQDGSYYSRVEWSQPPPEGEHPSRNEIWPKFARLWPIYLDARVRASAIPPGSR